MKHIKKYNESVKDFLKPKSKEEILKSSKNLDPQEKFEKGCKLGILWLVKQGMDEGADIINFFSSDHELLAWEVALNNEHFDVLEYLINIPIVKQILSMDEIEYYQEQIDEYRNGLKESVKDFLKPKPEEEILNKMQDLSPYKKFYRGCQHGILAAVKQSIEDGVNPTIERNVGIRFASSKGYTDIVKYLLSFDRVIPPDDAIEDAAKNNHGEILELLLDHKRVDYDPTKNNYYIINYCAVNQKYSSLKVLLNNELVKKKWNGQLDKYEKELEEYEKNK